MGAGPWRSARGPGCRRSGRSDELIDEQKALPGLWDARDFREMSRVRSGAPGLIHPGAPSLYGSEVDRPQHPGDAVGDLLVALIDVGLPGVHPWVGIVAVAV